jgi:hypothetical protein
MMMRFSMLVLVLMFVVGCAATTSQTFDVRVKNDSSKPITVWLTKVGPPFEPKWASPEDIATERPGGSNTYLGVIVPPSKTGETGSVEAILQPDTTTWLRIYSNAEKFSELLAMSKGNPNRLDIKLEPGVNSFVVTDSPGGIVASRVETPAP